MKLRSLGTFASLLLIIAYPRLAAAADGVGVVRPYLPGTLIFSLIIAACHIFSPQLFRMLKKREAFVGSFGGGMAVTYVFVVLLPELDKGHELLGRFIFFLSLISFVLFYGMQELAARRSATTGERCQPSFHLRIFQVWVYNCLIVLGTPEHAFESGWAAVPVTLGLGMHLVHMDYNLSEIFPKQMRTWGRFVLAIAPLAGWLTALVLRGGSDRVNDIGVAILAGSLLYAVFKEELPEHGTANFFYFILGVAFFVGLVLVEINL